MNLKLNGAGLYHAVQNGWIKLPMSNSTTKQPATPMERHFDAPLPKGYQKRPAFTGPSDEYRAWRKAYRRTWMARRRAAERQTRDNYED